MKRFLSAIAFAFITSISFAQQQTNIGCVDRDIRLQSEELRGGFLKQGLVVYRDAMLTMERNAPAAIGVQLTKGEMYQMIYVANRASSKMELEIFDGNDKKIGSKSAGGSGQNNYIIYSFIPEKTDIYLVTLSQKFKGQSVCGSFTILQEAPPIKEEPKTAEQPKQQENKKNTTAPQKKK